MRMPWLDSLTLGIGGFDDDHRHMFDLLSELNASVTTGNLSGVRVLFDELHATTLAHFRHEEDLMARTCYPRAVAHMAEHDLARLGLMALNGQIASGRLDQMPELLAEFAGRYFTGVLKDDGLFVRFLRELEPG